MIIEEEEEEEEEANIIRDVGSGIGYNYDN
jgi:hypothetical protein